MKPSLAASWRLLGAALAAFALAACGGGGAGGVGSGGTGIAAVTTGTIDGFGSLIVDGIAWDDGDAPTEVELRPDVAEPASARLGQQVAIEARRDGVAERVTLRPQLRARVDALVAGGFLALGQAVRINADPAAGPVTQFGGGLDGPTSLRPGMAVEVHGLPVRSGGAWALQATRIDRLDALPLRWLVAGIATEVGRPAGRVRLRIGALQVEAPEAALRPASARLAEGLPVTVWAMRGAIGGSDAAPSLVAERIRVEPRADGTRSGVVAALDESAARFALGEVTVDFAGAQVVPRRASLADGRYVRVRGAFAADGRFVAEQVQLRGVDGAATTTLRGPIGGWDAATQRFRVRGVEVSAAAAALDGCPADGLADGLVVEVEGRAGFSLVTAERIRCRGR